MTAPGWDNDAWQQIADYEKFWTPFDARFCFRAGMDPGAWLAIVEPAGSIVFDLGPVFARDGGFAADEDALNGQVLAAMTATFRDEEPLVALDWQHPAYWFWPHRQAVSSEPWRVPAFPNGDYYALVTQDFQEGTFGHPWEQTLCVWGTGLVAALAPKLAQWVPVKRRN